MTCTYQLVFGESTLESESREELKEFAKSIKGQYWEIFKVYSSSMVEHPTSKLNIMDMREIMKLHGRGWTSGSIAIKFSIPQSQIKKALRSMHI